MLHSTLAVLGEALVDEFQDGPVAGGAPFNVARSAAALGVPTLFISRIGGDDANGRLVLESARRCGLNTAGMQLDPMHATGRVSVHESPGAGHRFEVHGDAAWDHIETPAALAALQAQPATLAYFGTLAQRGGTSRATIRAVMKAHAGIRLLDLNLREGSDNRLLAAESLMLADWLKVNDEELAQLAAWFAPDAKGEAAIVSALMARFVLERLVLTRGPEGWALYGPDGQLAQGPGTPQPRIVDTVGAGDSFTALLLCGLALERELGATLALASRYASFICGLRGPLPAGAQALNPWRHALHSLPSST
ncbi:MAG: fructokinase [Paucibacter sp.]|nr:fructokinase [Roseateles sp.]